MNDLSQLKVAIVCDWLTGLGGAERVVYELHRMFPQAPIYTSQYDPQKIDWFRGADVRTGWLQKLPVGLKKFLPVLRAVYFSRLRLEGYDLVISSSGAEAKAVKVSKGTTHICYCHAPTHYYWSRYEAYLREPGFGAFDWLARIGLTLLAGPMRLWDYRAAHRPDHLVTNSTHTQLEIKRYYGREATVVYPPVDIARFAAIGQAGQPRHGFVAAGRQTAYKRIDLAVKACTRLGLPLTVVGDGPEHRKLRKLAGPSVHFTGAVSEAAMATYFRTASAFLFPGVDDFGIIAVEALAAGTPVIAYRAGGALDYVVPGQTGEFFTSPTVKSLSRALQTFDAGKFNEQAIAQEATHYSVEAFASNLRSYVQTVLSTNHQA